MGTFSIGALAKATQTKVETIRFYEQCGILPSPQRTGSNYRVYAAQDLQRLSFIRRARDLGFSLDQVRTLLSLSDNPEQPCEEVDKVARERLLDVERKIADLSKLRRELRGLIEQCGCGTVAECRIIEALGPPHR